MIEPRNEDPSRAAGIGDARDATRQIGGDGTVTRSPEGADEAASAWLAHMQRGDYAAAWRVSDSMMAARSTAPPRHLPRHLQSVWTGVPLQGRRVLVRCYHGLGDTLQFIRYAPLVSAIASELTIWVQPALIPLLATMKGIGRLVPLHEGVSDAEYDVDVELMELPHVFRTTLDSVPSEVPYIHVPPLSREPAKMAVGIVWGGGDWDARRSVPYEMLDPLGRVPGVDLQVLQLGPQRAEWRPGFGTLAKIRDAYEQARFIRSLELVISVDSMPAHLAGALGAPVWTLLHHEPDWRWMSQGERTPWYPTMRLFRQSQPGEWAPVIARVAKELALAARAARQYPETHPYGAPLHRAS
jgi:hypothetical protein